jgi:hypothetical protein
MTLNEFLTELEATPREWTVRVRFNRAEIRLKARGKRESHCPLSAVSGANPCSVIGSADVLGLRPSTAWRVADAADAVDGYDPTLRARLKKACGLR